MRYFYLMTWLGIQTIWSILLKKNTDFANDLENLSSHYVMKGDCMKFYRKLQHDNVRVDETESVCGVKFTWKPLQKISSAWEHCENSRLWISSLPLIKRIELPITKMSSNKISFYGFHIRFQRDPVTMRNGFLRMH